MHIFDKSTMNSSE